MDLGEQSQKDPGGSLAPSGIVNDRLVPAFRFQCHQADDQSPDPGRSLPFD
jgi:hypothetical protein